MTLIENLVAVRKLLEDPTHWVKGTFALDINDLAVSSDNPGAVKWCLVGAIGRVCGSYPEDHPPARDVRVALLKELPHPQSLSDFNDSSETSHEDIMRLLDRAIVDANQGV